MQLIVSLMVRVALIWSIVIGTSIAHENVLSVSVPKPGDPPDQHAIRMIDRLRGWTIADHSFFSTVDGARNWKRVPVDSSPFQLRGSWGVTADGGAWSLAVRSWPKPADELLRMTPDGSTEHLPLPCNEQKCVAASVDFDPAGKNGLLLGLVAIDSNDSRISAFRTFDGGHRWLRIAAPDTTVFRSDVTVKWAADKQAFIANGCEFFTTSDFGDSWHQTPDKDIPDAMCEQDSLPFSVRLVRPGMGWLRTSTGRVFWTGNGGASWNASALAEGRNPFLLGMDEWVSFVDALHGLIVMNGQILATRDGGRTWSPLTQPGEPFHSVSCAGGRCILRSQTRVAEFTFDN